MFILPWVVFGAYCATCDPPTNFVRQGSHDIGIVVEWIPNSALPISREAREVSHFFVLFVEYVFPPTANTDINAGEPTGIESRGSSVASNFGRKLYWQFEFVLGRDAEFSTIGEGAVHRLPSESIANINDINSVEIQGGRSAVVTDCSSEMYEAVGRKQHVNAIDMRVTADLSFSDALRNTVSFSCPAQSATTLPYRNQQGCQTDRAQERADYAEPVRPHGGVRGFFSGNSSAPLGAQISAIVILSVIAGVGFFGGICGKPRVEWLRSVTLCGSIGLAALLVWLTSPVTS